MKNTQRKYHKKIMYTFKIKYFHFQHIIIRGWIFYKDGTWVSAISIIMIEGQVLLSLYTSLITWQLGRHNVFNTSPCCQYVFTNSPRRRQWSSWCSQWSSVHRQEVVSDRKRSWPSCQQIVICTFMCCHWGVNRSSIRRQANHLAMYWRCTGDFWWISSREDGASASPDVASWCERGFTLRLGTSTNYYCRFYLVFPGAATDFYTFKIQRCSLQQIVEKAGVSSHLSTEK